MRWIPLATSRLCHGHSRSGPGPSRRRIGRVSGAAGQGKLGDDDQHRGSRPHGCPDNRHPRRRHVHASRRSGLTGSKAGSRPWVPAGRLSSGSPRRGTRGSSAMDDPIRSSSACRSTLAALPSRPARDRLPSVRVWLAPPLARSFPLAPSPSTSRQPLRPAGCRSKSRSGRTPSHGRSRHSAR